MIETGRRVRQLSIALGLGLALGVGTSLSWADAVSCQSRTPSCPQGAPTSPTVYLKDFNCQSQPKGPNPIPDKDCWQQAIDCATSGTKFGTVVATAGMNYQISDTLCLKSVTTGVIEGNGATLTWTDTTPDPLKPLIFLAEAEEMKIQDLTLKADSSHPLNTAILSVNTTGGLVTTRNILEHVRINGTNNGGLQFGVRYAGPSSFTGTPLGVLVDEMNDQSTFMDVEILQVEQAAISLEHSQSMGHRLINVTASSTSNATDSCFVEVTGGYFTSYGGTRTDFTGAEFRIGGIQHGVSIIDSNSEGCKRFIDGTGWDTNTRPVQVIGGRFAVDNVASDGYVINYERRGPVSIHGLQLTGSPAVGGVQPKFRFSPAAGGDMQVEVSGCRFGSQNSISWDPISISGNVRLVAHGNSCRPNIGGGDIAEPCIGNAAGIATFGSPASTSGVLRVPNNDGLTARDSTNVNNVNVAKLNASNEAELGDATHATGAPGGLKIGSGTLLTKAICGTASIDPTNAINANSTLVVSGTANGLLAQDSCSCSPRTEWDDDVIMKACYAGTNLLSVRLYKSGSGNVNNAPNVDVDYCCIRKP